MQKAVRQTWCSISNYLLTFSSLKTPRFLLLRKLDLGTATLEI